jgi:MFS family permease
LEEKPWGGAREDAAAVARALAATPAGRMPQVVRALRNPNFRLFWSGNFLSNIGTWMQNVAQGWLVLLLTANSAFWLGVVGFAGSIPFLLFTLFGGVIADRVNKRQLLLFTQSAMMTLAFLLAGLAYWKVITVWEVALIAFLNGTAMAMNAPCYQALVPQLVEREDLTNAIALNSAQFNMSRFLGPTLGGYAMAVLGVAGNFFLNGVSFLAVLAALLRLHYPAEAQQRHPSLLSSLGAGLGYLRAHREMYVLAWMVALFSLLAMPFITFIPYFARSQLHTGAAGLGWLLAGSGSAGVLGAVVVAAGYTARHRGRIIPATGLTLFVSMIVFAYSHSFALSECMACVEGFSGMLMLSSVNVVMQLRSSNPMRGRVMSIYSTCFLGLPPLGSLLAGGLARHFSIAHVLAVMSGLATLAFLGFFTFSRELRELD